MAHPPRVRFDQSFEHVRTFYKNDCPAQIASGLLPGKEQILFSKDGFATQNVHLKKIAMAPDQNLRGSVLVKNLAFVKSVICRFTFDGWATFSDVCASYAPRAEYKRDPEGYDRFNFSIDISGLTAPMSKTIILCVCFTCNDQMYWDSNNGANYEIPLAKQEASAEEDPIIPDFCRKEADRNPEIYLPLKVDKYPPLAVKTLNFNQPLQIKQLPMSTRYIARI
uniref:CBM21 domain-containing protein n=1 Tax=Bionectria ochroleuca TaxID=29856 RepID=A0A8H7K4H3_BIOOC